MEPKSIMQILLEEKVECIELIRSLLIERDIGFIIGETDEFNELNLQISALKKRQLAIESLIIKEEHRLENKMIEDFPAFVIISQYSPESI